MNKINKIMGPTPNYAINNKKSLFKGDGSHLLINNSKKHNLLAASIINQAESLLVKSSQLKAGAKHFRYSKLALAVSVCLLAQFNFYSTAEAATKTTEVNDTLASASATDDSSTFNNPNYSDDDSLEEALIALKLKKAVEQGIIDQSVLDDYQRETLSRTNLQHYNSSADSINADLNNITSPNSNKINLSSSNSPLLKEEMEFNKDVNSQSVATLNSEPKSILANSDSNSDYEFDNKSFNEDEFFELNFDDLNSTQNVEIDSPEQINQVLQQSQPKAKTEFEAPVSTLDSNTLPLGYDKDIDDSANFEPNNRNTLGLDENDPSDLVVDDSGADTNHNNQQGLNPEDYLPDYELEDESYRPSDKVVNDKEEAYKDKPGLIKGLYNRLFNDGYSSIPKINASVYIEDKNKQDKMGKPILKKADNDSQPIKNIEAAMENISVEAIKDFTAVLPKLREEAVNAAKAVGYYDIELFFQKVSDNKINVIIQKLGEPVKVNSRVIDIRGEGAELAELKEIVKSANPDIDDTFNHGEYKNTKATIEAFKERYGFFDGQWLNKSVDIILPDNTADIDLIFDSGKRYHFDEVIFFTIDHDTGELTTNPDKLPVKPELLQQIYDFNKGDDYYGPLVTKFTNDLAATQYFNAVNVEVVRPDINNSDNSTLGFEDEADALDDTELENTDENGNNTNNSMDNDIGVDTTDEDIKPIEFSVDQETNERLLAIKIKANRLSSLPDDRVLDEEKEDAKSFLGKLTNAISSAVEKVFPDDKDPFANTDSLSNSDGPPSIANKITPEQVAENKLVPLYVFVTANKPRDVDLGVGYGTDTGVRTVARLKHNLINRDGYQAGISVGASKINKHISLQGKRPWKHPLDDTLNANLTVEQDKVNQGEGNLDLLTNTVKAKFARNIKNESGWNRTYSATYRLDQLESRVKGPDRVNLPVPFNREGAKFNQQALLFGYAMDKTDADSLTNPTKGVYQYYSVEAGSNSLATDTDMAIVKAGVSGIYSFGDMNKHQVIGSVEGGYIWADDFEDVPYKLRFFAGGDRSLRGYDYKSLSTLENGYLIGGQILALASAEYNYEFKPGLRGAVFADVGNAYDTDFETDTKLGVGAGIRWTSPVGVVRLDLAAGVLENSIPIRLHFFIGSPLK